MRQDTLDELREKNIEIKNIRGRCELLLKENEILADRINVMTENIKRVHFLLANMSDQVTDQEDRDYLLGQVVSKSKAIEKLEARLTAALRYEKEAFTAGYRNGDEHSYWDDEQCWNEYMRDKKKSQNTG